MKEENVVLHRISILHTSNKRITRALRSAKRRLSTQNFVSGVSAWQETFSTLSLERSSPHADSGLLLHRTASWERVIETNVSSKKHTGSAYTLARTKHPTSSVSTKNQAWSSKTKPQHQQPQPSFIQNQTSTSRIQNRTLKNPASGSTVNSQVFNFSIKKHSRCSNLNVILCFHNMNQASCCTVIQMEQIPEGVSQ